MSTTAETPTSIDLWLTDRAQQDYSWKALSKRHVPGLNISLTDFWRRSSSPNHHTGAETLRTDDELLAVGLLVDLGERELFHIAYIPQVWFDKLPEERRPSRKYAELLDQAWADINQIYSNRVPRVFQGVFLNSQAATQLAVMSDMKFEQSCFVDELNISVVAGHLSFQRSLFLGKVISRGFVHSSREPKSLVFEECEFFDKTTFEVGEFNADMSLDKCHFHSTFLISEAGHIRSIRIDSCHFHAFFSITQSKIALGFSLFLSEFYGNFELLDCQFGGAATVSEITLHSDVTIVACRFGDRVRFVDMSWPRLGANTAWAHETLFSDDVVFSGVLPPPIQLFDDVRFEGSVSFSHTSDKSWLASFDGELRAIQEGLVYREAPTKIRRLESGCRVLRNLAGSAGNVHLEHQWHRCELVARRNTDDVSALERSLSYLYGFCADYGLSVFRPFVILGALCLVFGVVFAILHSGIRPSADIDWETLTEGFGYSLNRTLPIGVFDFSDSVWRKELLGNAGTWWSIAVRFLASLQSIVSVILIYIGVMAARRKFKIT